MDPQRLILFFAFTLSLFLLLDAWQRDQRATRAPAEEARTTVAEPAPAQPAADVPVPTQDLIAREPGVPPRAEAKPILREADAVVRVETDLMVAEISTFGGDLRRLQFRQHRDTVDRNADFVLLENTPERTYIAQSGLVGGELPNHRTVYQATATEYRLADGVDQLEVRLEAPERDGLRVAKIYRFRRDSYLIDVSFEIENGSAAALQPYAYFQIVRDSTAPIGDSWFLPTFTGVAVYTEAEKFQKVSFSDIDRDRTPYPRSSQDGWIAMLQHYFVSAWLPAEGLPREYYTRRLDEGLYAAGTIVPVGSIPAGQAGRVTVSLYSGPQEQEKLAQVAKGLELAVDYGWLTVISVPLFWLLSWLHKWVNNWGVAIILLTVIIKLVFYPLSAASYRSMAKMRVLAPKLQKLKDQYGNDRQRMQQAMMDLYRSEKINPLGGCMPILVQIPVFIALYWVLLASVELRHAPFMLWITDLSSPDPWFILPILMGLTMIVQTRLNPVPPDPVQAKMMKILPVVFSIFFFFFPAGLVLYWLVNNILSIAQQWQITRAMEQGAAAGARKK